jgi:uncharacterized membrane protein YphA (DoxX/SURF4 family)
MQLSGYASAFAGVVAALLVIYGAFTIMTSSGDPNKIQEGQDMIVYALMGLAVVIFAVVIVLFGAGMWGIDVSGI